MRRLYTIVLYLLAPLAVARLLWLGLRSPDYRERMKERFGWVPALPEDRPVLWVHAVSVGEVQAAKPLLTELVSRFPKCRVVVSTTTPTGARTVERQFGTAVHHIYFPYDLPGAVSRSLARIHPRLVIVMETEIWPNFYAACATRDIPLVMANARMSPRSAARYALGGRLIASCLATVRLIAAQAPGDAERFISLGAPRGRVRIYGNVKFDIRPPRSTLEKGQAIRRALGPDRPVWIAASTHPGEERLILDALTRVRSRHPSSLLVLAPRHPERASQVRELCERSGLASVQRTGGDPCGPDTAVFILDSLGELGGYYASADVAFVGGSLVPIGGHNVLEAAALGIPVITGPHIFKIASISGPLMESGALLVVYNQQELGRTVAGLLDDANRRFTLGEQAKRVFSENQGCTARLVGDLQEVLSTAGA